MSKPIVAVVGRPNVGKSTLLNRIVGRMEAIVEPRPGVTRDRKAVDAEWQGDEFTLVDTGGWISTDDGIDGAVSRQSEVAIGDADAVLFVVDAVVGVTADDERVAALLQRTGRPVLVVANKVDDQVHEAGIWDLLSLGLGEPHAVSALHGRGTGDLLDALVDVLPGLGSERPELDPDAEFEEPDENNSAGEILSVALVGRPNAGKSTLFNRLLSEERAVVNEAAGTTRDAIDTVLETDDGPIRFIDTAGMRRRARIDEHTEYYSLVRALRAVDDADVALLVIDTTVGVTHQDQRLAERVHLAGCPVVILANKWDIADIEIRETIEEEVGDRLGFLGEVPLLRVSGLTGRGVQRLLPAIVSASDAYHRRVPTSALNRVLRRAQSATPAPAGARVLYGTQGASHPPTFTLFANKRLPRTYVRYLEKQIQAAFGLERTPVKLRLRVRSR
jgi:GTP-binding protein